MRLTRFGLHGLLFHGVMVGAFLASPYSNLFFLLLAFLTLAGLAGALGAWRNLRGVTGELGELPPVAAGTPLHVPLALRADAPARFGVEAVLRLEGGARLAGRVERLEGSATLSLAGEPLPRGCHALREAFASAIHPFGIVRTRRALALRPGAELVVYPAPLEALVGRTAGQALDELLGRTDPGPGDLQPAGLRDHRASDGVRGVHWRASARRGSLVVTEWEGASGCGLEVLLDRRAAPDELERALSAISALVLLARAGKESLSLATQGLRATFGPGQRPWSEALRFLARAQALPADGPAPPAVSPAVLRLPRARVHA